MKYRNMGDSGLKVSLAGLGAVDAVLKDAEE